MLYGINDQGRPSPKKLPALQSQVLHMLDPTPSKTTFRFFLYISARKIKRPETRLIYLIADIFGASLWDTWPRLPHTAYTINNASTRISRDLIVTASLVPGFAPSSTGEKNVCRFFRAQSGYDAFLTPIQQQIHGKLICHRQLCLLLCTGTRLATASAVLRSPNSDFDCFQAPDTVSLPPDEAKNVISRYFLNEGVFSFFHTSVKSTQERTRVTLGVRPDMPHSVRALLYTITNPLHDMARLMEQWGVPSAINRQAQKYKTRKIRSHRLAKTRRGSQTTTSTKQSDSAKPCTRPCIATACDHITTQTVND